MEIILPKDKLQDFESKITPQLLKEARSKKVNKKVMLMLPKFKITG